MCKSLKRGKYVPKMNYLHNLSFNSEFFFALSINDVLHICLRSFINQLCNEYPLDPISSSKG